MILGLCASNPAGFQHSLSAGGVGGGGISWWATQDGVSQSFQLLLRTGTGDGETRVGMNSMMATVAESGRETSGDAAEHSEDLEPMEELGDSDAGPSSSQGGAHLASGTSDSVAQLISILHPSWSFRGARATVRQSCVTYAGAAELNQRAIVQRISQLYRKYQQLHRALAAQELAENKVSSH